MTNTSHGARRRTTAARLRGGLVTLLCLVVTLVALGFLVPAAFGLERYVITGKSMTGTVNFGSVVFEKTVPASELRVGDVITYLPPSDSGIDHLVTHRIISIDGDQLRTQGDANATPDPWTFRLTQATQPRMAFHVPYLGYAFLALQDRTTRILLIGVPAGLIALLSLAELVVAARHDEQVLVPAAVPIATTARGLVPAQPGPGDAGVPRMPSRQPARPTRTELDPESEH